MDDVSSEVSNKLSGNVLFSNPESCSNFQGSTSMNTITELSKNTTKTCTHTHTCIPPGPDDVIHTHTCFHTHFLFLLKPLLGQNGFQEYYYG